MPTEITFEETNGDPAKHALVMALLRRHGSHSMAYAALQPGMTYFIEPAIGFIAFMKPPSSPDKVWALGDPFADSGEPAVDLVRQFVTAYPKARLIQLTAPRAQEIHAAVGLHATPIGIETRLDLSKFTWAGSPRKRIRTSVRSAGKRATVRELAEPTDSELDAIRHVSAEWVRSRRRTNREIILMDRPMIDLRDPLLRRFGAFDGQEMIGFLICNPVFVGGEASGYLMDITRTRPEAHSGTGDLLWHAAVETFRREGRRFVDLGLSPCYRVGEDPLRLHDSLTRTALALLFRRGNWIFNFRGLARRKRQFGGAEFHVYVLHRERCALPAIYQLLRLCRIL